MSDTEKRDDAPVGAEAGATATASGASSTAVTATIDLTEQDVRAGLDDMSGGRVRRAIVFGAVALCVLGYAIIQHDRPSVLTAVPGAVGLAVFGCFMFLMRGRGARQQVEALRKAGDTLVTYRFDDEGFVLRSAGASASVAYRRVIGTRVGKHTLLLFTSPRIAQIIPLRAFSPGDLARVRAWLPAHPPAQLMGKTKRILLLWVVLVGTFFAVWQLLSADQHAPKNHRRDGRTTNGSRSSE